MRRIGVRSLLAAALLLAASRASAQFHLGAEVGADSGCKDAVEGFPNTLFVASPLFGGSLGYRFGFGLDLELAFHQLSPKLKEGGVEIATVTLVPILLRLGYVWVPPSTGFGVRAALGAGAVASNFRKGPWLQAFERQYGVEVRSWAKGDSFSFELLAGLDYFPASWISLGADARFLVARRDIAWDVGGAAGHADLPEAKAFVLVSGEVGVVVRFWPWR